MTLRRILATAVLALLGAGVLPMSSAYACSCAAPPGEGDTLEGTVFSGTVTRRDAGRSSAVYYVDVDRVYAGSVGAKAEVHTHAHGATCGLEIPSSGPAVFFAREEDGVLTANLCGGTHTGSAPAWMGEGTSPTAATTPPAATPRTTPAAAPGEPDGGNDVLPVAVAFAAIAGVGLLVTRRPSLRQ